MHRKVFFLGGALIAAVTTGWQIANENLWPSFAISCPLFLWMISSRFGVRSDAFLAGLVMAGYLIGGRGFAQLSLPKLPILPGELVLAIGMAVVGWEAVRSRVVPWQRDALNGALLAWLSFGVVRFGVDARVHGLVALRDFAVVYYALFFFLAQAWWADSQRRLWVGGCLSAGFAIGALTFIAFARWPEVVVSLFSINGVPIIFIKSDVQAGLLVAGTFWFASRYATTRSLGWLALALMSLIGVVFSNSRAGLLSLLAVVIWILACRQFRLIRPLLVPCALGAALLLLAPVITQTPLENSLAFRFYESIASVTDLGGERTYKSVDLGDKSDNNQFRLIWWKSVAAETWSEGRWIGLGFGHDLADQFVRTYYPQGSDEFHSRSPHNYLITLFGRTGIVGVVLFGLCLSLIAARTWQAGRLAACDRGSLEAFVLWIGAWGILVSACFGVVLEGPMGATIFWSLMGMANASAKTTSSEP